jgi:hypothetical protein
MLPTAIHRPSTNLTLVMSANGSMPDVALHATSIDPASPLGSAVAVGVDVGVGSSLTDGAAVAEALGVALGSSLADGEGS